MLKKHNILIVLLFLLGISLENSYGQSDGTMSAMPDGVTVSGIIKATVQGNSHHAVNFSDGLIFALSADRQEVLGFSETTHASTGNHYNAYSFRIDGLPKEGDVIIYGFKENVKRFYWMLVLPMDKIADAGQRHQSISLGTVVADMSLPMRTPTDLTDTGNIILGGKALAVQALLYAGYIAQQSYDLYHRSYAFVDEMSNMLYEYYNTRILTGFDRFNVTSKAYEHNADLNEAVIQEFGYQYRIADWNDLVGYYQNDGDLSDLFHELNISGRESVYVTRNGKSHHTSRRAYFASFHQHSKPRSYLAHENLNRYEISLGSWDGSRRILVIQK